MYGTQYIKIMRHLFFHYTRIPLLVEGGTGIGKSEIARNLARQLQHEWEAMSKVPATAEQAKALGPVGYTEANLTACEYADLVGMPIIVVKEFPDGTKKSVTDWAPPAWLAETERFDRGILLFEEVNRLELQTRQGYMQLLDTRRIGNVRIPDGWLIVQTANPDEEGYHVGSWDKALLRRSAKLLLEGDLREWQTYGMSAYDSPIKAGEHIHPKVLAVSTRLGNQGLFEKVDNKAKTKPTYYGLVIVSELMQSGISELDSETRMQLMGGIIGSDAAQMLETSLSDDNLKRLIEMFRRKESLKGQNQDVLCDVMFMAVDEARRDQKAYAEQLQVLWKALPNDVKPVLATTCYPWMLQHREYRTWKLEWREWCQENWDFIMNKGVDPGKTGQEAA